MGGLRKKIDLYYEEEDVYWAVGIIGIEGMMGFD